MTDAANHVIRLVTPGKAGRADTLAGMGEVGNRDGANQQATFNNPQGITLDNRGHLWVVDTGNHTVRRINLVRQEVETIAGLPGNPGFVDGNGAAARFNAPLGITIETEPLAQQLSREARGEPPPPVSVIVADTGNGQLRRVTEEGDVETVGVSNQTPAGSRPTQSSVDSSSFNSPTGVAVDPFGTIYVTEPQSGEVKAILPNGNVVAAAQPETFSNPRGVVVAEGGKLLVSDGQLSGSGNSIRKSFHLRRRTSGDRQQWWGSSGSNRAKLFAGFSGHSGRCGDRRRSDPGYADTFLHCASATHRTHDASHSKSRRPWPRLHYSSGAVALSDLPNGHITTVAGGTTFAGDGLRPREAIVARPRGVAVDSRGNIFVADTDNNRVRRIDALTGIINTVAGFGPPTGASQDNIPATVATLAAPVDIAVDVSTSLFIVENSLHRVRRVDLGTE